MRLPLLPLIVLVLARPSTAGICWSGMERGGRCSSVVALRVGRAECCAGAARSPAAWSPRDLDSGEIFFFKALSGGVPCTACAESCAGVSCGSGRRCVVRGGRARCVCAAACRRVGPVCGTDGKTYPSLCRLRRRACRRPAKHLALDYPGPCQEGSCDLVRCGGDKRCVLDAELGAHCVRCGGCNVAGAPVCAVDGKTYAGACALRKAACERGRALPLAYRGSCIANATCANIRCGAGQRCVAGGASGARCVSCGSCGGGARRPLCGSDARTYPSWCRLQRAACHAGRVVDPLHPGPCKGYYYKVFFIYCDCQYTINLSVLKMESNQTNYFESYEDLEIHRLMLEDESRNKAYKDAIMNNKSYLKDKTVMDVGCGTGILSIFCAQAGAKKVYAVEASNLANLAKEIVKENNFENVIEVIHSKVEDVSLPNNIKVDVIVSEWMGFYLLHEGMLDSVLVARDKFLKDDGQMFPESATIYIAPCSVPTLYQKWDNLHGISMSLFAKHLRESRYNKPEIMHIQSKDLLASETALCWINLKEDTASDLDSYSIQHVATISKNGSYQGLCVWFECTFPNITKDGDASQVRLDTSPNSLPTHWKQAVIVLPQAQEVEEGEPIAFQLDMIRDQLDKRRYNLELTLLDPEVVEHPLPCTCHMTKCILTKAVLEQHAEKTIVEVNSNSQKDSILIEEDIDDEDSSSSIYGED